jgi:hypothetical protein
MPEGYPFLSIQHEEDAEIENLIKESYNAYSSNMDRFTSSDENTKAQARARLNDLKNTFMTLDDVQFEIECYRKAPNEWHRRAPPVKGVFVIQKSSDQPVRYYSINDLIGPLPGQHPTDSNPGSPQSSSPRPAHRRVAEAPKTEPSTKPAQKARVYGHAYFIGAFRNKVPASHIKLQFTGVSGYGVLDAEARIF